MDNIQRDPYAMLGYKARQHPEYLTLNMGAEPQGNYGLYSYMPSLTEPPTGTIKRNGEMNVAVDLPPQHYGSIIAHELGHVGARNSRTEREAAKASRNGEEEKRQRLTDYLLNPPDSQAHKDAIAMLRYMGLSAKDIGIEAAKLKKKQGIKSRWQEEAGARSVLNDSPLKSPLRKRDLPAFFKKRPDPMQ
jgi:hypothetical protein